MFFGLNDFITEILRALLPRDGKVLSKARCSPQARLIVKRYRWENPKCASNSRRGWVEPRHGIIFKLLSDDTKMSLTLKLTHEKIQRVKPLSQKPSLVHHHPRINNFIVNKITAAAVTSRMEAMSDKSVKFYTPGSFVPKSSYQYISDSRKGTALKYRQFDNFLNDNRVRWECFNQGVPSCARVICQDPKILTVLSQRIDLSDNNKLFKILSGAKTIEPIKRGGGPRGRKENIPTKVELAQKPEIICWKREMQWMVGLEIPEEIAERSDFSIIRNEKRVEFDQYHAGRWPFEGLSGTVMVRWAEQGNIEETVFLLEDQNYFLFKLSGRQHNFGRQIGAPSSGWYVVVAPEGWKRYEPLSGPPPANPGFLSFAGYIVHFFYLERGDTRKIAFRDSNDDTIEIKSTVSDFVLSGKLIVDENKEMGPLFGKAPPRIRAERDNAWANTGTVVIGEEGPGRNKWRTQFRPIPHVMEQCLPDELLKRKGGWYFLRFYDKNDNLVESLQFRYLEGLNDIKFSSPPCFPKGEGHTSVRIEVLHGPDCFVKEYDRTSSEIMIEENYGKTILKIPSQQNYDEMHWQIGYAGGSHVEVTILVDRVWWAVGEEHEEPTEWTDRAVSLSSDDLRATSGKAIWILFHKPSSVDAVSVGFCVKNARTYGVQITKRAVCIPLRDYCDADELLIPGVKALGLWVCYHGISYGVRLCEFKVKAGCKWCNFSAETIDELLCHVESEHMNEVIEDFVPPWNYDQIRNIIPDLPYKIYKCFYCDFYAKSNDITNPTSAIYEHLKRHGKKKFRIVSDVNEIRQHVIKKLPRIYECIKCGSRFENPTDAALLDHLKEKHIDNLYRCV